MGFLRFGQSLIILVALLTLPHILPFHELLKPEFLRYSIFIRLPLMYVAILGVRVMYEYIWTFVNSAIIFSGFAYNGRDDKGNIRWDRALNLRLFDVEFATSPRQAVMNWNITIAKWLRHCLAPSKKSSNLFFDTYQKPFRLLRKIRQETGYARSVFHQYTLCVLVRNQKRLFLQSHPLFH